jgi:hypothetical protein
MNETQLTQAVTVAQHYNHSDVWDAESFRFKTTDGIDKSALLTFKDADIIEARDDAWSQTTWEWTDNGSVAIEMVDTSPITNASEQQLTALSEHADVLLNLPRTEDFLASEYDLIGQTIQTLSDTGLLTQVDTVGQLSVWELSNFALRLLTSLESEEMRVSGNANNFVTADD